MTKILGLTGGIASGKSTISQYFRELGIPVIDADKVAHDVMRAGEPVVCEIADTFGKEYILPNGEIDRTKLGDTVFADPAKRMQLNEIVQGEIRAEIERTKEVLVKGNTSLVVLDIPLLFEGKYEDQVDIVMVVYVDGPTQKERLLKRNTDLNSDDADNRIQSQMPMDIKAARADVVIDNNGTIEETRTQVEKWMKENFPLIHANA